MPNLEVPVPYEIDEHDLELIRQSQIKPIKPEPLNYIDILEERKERVINNKQDFSNPELEKSEKEILKKLARL